MVKQALDVAKGIIEVSNAANFNLSKEGFYKFIRANAYEKVGPGMYISPEEFADDLLVLHKRCPHGVISHDEALYFYGLTDREPMAHTITVYSGYNAARLNRSGYKIYYVNKNLLEVGKQSVTDHFGNEIPMYDMERTIVDLMRCRNKFEIQDFTAALKNYAHRTDKDLAKLYDYAEIFRVGKILREYMKVLL